MNLEQVETKSYQKRSLEFFSFGICSKINVHFLDLVMVIFLEGTFSAGSRVIKKVSDLTMWSRATTTSLVAHIFDSINNSFYIRFT